MYICDLYIFKTDPIIVYTNITTKEVKTILDNANCKFNINLMHQYFSRFRFKKVYTPRSKEFSIARISNTLHYKKQEKK